MKIDHIGPRNRNFYWKYWKRTLRSVSYLGIHLQKKSSVYISVGDTLHLIRALTFHIVSKSKRNFITAPLERNLFFITASELCL